MPNPDPRPIFTVASSAHRVALCSLTVVHVERRALVFTDARCPDCDKILMFVPGVVIVEVRPVRTIADRSGRGRVVRCPNDRCKHYAEVIEHG